MNVLTSFVVEEGVRGWGYPLRNLLFLYWRELEGHVGREVGERGPKVGDASSGGDDASVVQMWINLKTNYRCYAQLMSTLFLILLNNLQLVICWSTRLLIYYVLGIHSLFFGIRRIFNAPNHDASKGE